MVTQLGNQQSVIVFMSWENKRRREGKDSNSRDGGGDALPPRCCYDFARQRFARRTMAGEREGKIVILRASLSLPLSCLLLARGSPLPPRNFLFSI